MSPESPTAPVNFDSNLVAPEDPTILQFVKYEKEIA